MQAKILGGNAPLIIDSANLSIMTHYWVSPLALIPVFGIFQVISIFLEVLNVLLLISIPFESLAPLF